ncbi:MAG: serine/threonine-protein kinase [Bacteroidia bacterium]|nr:serine/threonine-protein kinase [Bacteroidia bacterium]
MTANQWEQIGTYFDRISELKGKDRTDALDQLRTEIPDIYDELLELLQEDNSPHTIFHMRSLLDEDKDRIGENIGNYTLLELLGKGGMGEVYLAERSGEDFEQKVALKLVRSSLNKKELNRYFKEERQILAGLNHKHIAALYDGGLSEDGFPFFTMEFVEGLPLTEYAKIHKLNVTEKLELFLQVCSAVSYSHQKLLAHLDLKPGNILVNKEGEVKLLDFGIASLPDSKKEQQNLRFTPAYASPEQLHRKNPSGSSDIFSLGVILFELISESLPRQTKEQGILAWKKLSFELDKKDFPSMPADLKEICWKSLQKNIEDRYSSVDLLMADIKAYLSGYPISIKAKEKAHVFAKYLRRNRSAVILIGLAALLLSGTIFSYTQRLESERNTARKEAEKANQMSSFMFSVFDGANPYENRGKEVTATQLLKKALTRMPEELAGQDEVMAQMTAAMGQIAIEMGEYPLADSLTYEALELLSRMEKPDLILHSDAWLFRADYFSQMGKYEEEGHALGEARKILMAEYGENDTLVANYLERMASNAYYQGDFSKADSLYRALISTYSEIFEDPRMKIVYPLTALGEVNNVLNKLEEADSILRIAVDMVSEVYPSPHTEIAYTNSIMSSVQYNRGNFPEALSFGKISHQNSLEIYGPNHKQRMDSWVNVARVYTGMDLFDSAIYVYDSLRTLSVEIHGGRDDSYYGQLTQSLANVYENMGELEKAEKLLLEARPILERNLPAGHPTLIYVYYSLGKVYLDQKKYPESKRLLDKGLSICTDYFGDEHPRCGLLEMAMGNWYIKNGEQSKGTKLLKDAQLHMEKWPRRYEDALKSIEKLLSDIK